MTRLKYLAILCTLLVGHLALTTPAWAGAGATGDDIPWDELNQATKFSSTNTRGLLAQILGGSAGSPGILTLAIVLGGFALLIMLVWGGFTMLSNPTNPQAQESGRNRITYAVIGFFLLFASFWIAQIIELIFGVSIVGG